MKAQAAQEDSGTTYRTRVCKDRHRVNLRADRNRQTGVKVGALQMPGSSMLYGFAMLIIGWQAPFPVLS